MARILPPALSRTQETQCVCTHEREQKSTRKVMAPGRHMALLLFGVSLVCGGFATLERQKCCWNWMAQVAAAWGAKKRKLKNSRYIISFMQPFISSCIPLIVRSREHIVIPKKNTHRYTHTHLLSTWKHSTPPVVHPLRAKRKSLSLLERVALHAWTHSNKWHDTTSAGHQRHRAVHGETSVAKPQQNGWWESTQRMLKRCSFSDMYFVCKVSITSD